MSRTHDIRKSKDKLITMKRFLPTLAILVTIMLSGCSLFRGNSNLPQVYTGYSANYIYAKAHQQMKDEDYSDSIRSYKSLVAQYPFTPLAEKGMTDLVYVYYKDGESTMSLALAKQFIKMYPYSKYKGYIYYMIGVVGFEDGRGVLQTYVPYDMSKHDPKSYLDAYHNFQKAVALDPKGTFAPDAKRRMIYINDIIAQHYDNIANFYYKRGAYNAAIDRAAQVIQDYPQSKFVENALAVTIKSYNKLGLQQQAKDNLEVLKKNYPKSKYLKNSDVDKSYTSWYDKALNWFYSWF